MQKLKTWVPSSFSCFSGGVKECVKLLYIKLTTGVMHVDMFD